MNLLDQLHDAPPALFYGGDCRTLLAGLRHLQPPVEAKLILADPPFFGRRRWFKRTAAFKGFTRQWLAAAAAAIDDGFVWINHEPQWTDMYARAAADARLIVLQQSEHKFKFNLDHKVSDWTASAMLLGTRPSKVRIDLSCPADVPFVPAEQCVRAVIRSCTAPGQWVIDPMCGSSGVVGKVARELGRPVVLNDIDPALVRQTAAVLRETRT